MGTQHIHVLYLDDEASNLVSFNANFRRDFNVKCVSTVQEALDYLEEHDVHVVISDHKMPNMTGVQFFERISLSHPDVIRILLTGYTDLDIVVDAINRGQVYRYFSKPMDPEEIRDTVISAYQFYKANKETRATYEKLLLENT